MSFMYYDLAILAVFCIFVITFLYIRRSRVKREGILFLYRTQTGLKTIDKLNQKFNKLWGKLGPVVIIAGFIFIVLIFILLIQSIFLTFRMPTKIPPIMPLVPYLPQAFKLPLPPFYFTYWIIIIAIVAVTHEFAHGIYARFHKIKVKSTGFGFLGPFPLAFVEPNEKQMSRKKKKAQLQILAAGSFSNFAFAAIFIILMQIFFFAAYQPAGLAYQLEYQKINLSQINSIGNYTQEDFFNLSDSDLENINSTLAVKTENATYWLDPSLIQSIPFLKKALLKQGAMVAYADSPAFKANLSGGLIAINNQKIEDYKQFAQIILNCEPGQNITIETSDGIYEITLDQNKDYPERGHIGLSFQTLQNNNPKVILAKATAPFFSPNTFVTPRFNEHIIKFISDLFLWLILICFFVALFNMLPVGFLDGGKFIYISALALTKSKKKAEIVFKISSYIVLLIFLALVFAWLLA